MKRTIQTATFLLIAAWSFAQQPIKVTDGATTVTVVSATAALKTDMTSVAGTATSTAASGVQLVGIEGRAGTSFESTAGVLDHNLKNVNNAAVSTAASGIQKVGIVGNAGASVDGATGSAVPANAVLVAGTDGTNSRATFMDPCTYLTWTYLVISVSGNTQIATTAGAAKNWYVCQFVILPVAAAANVNLVSSTTAGNACATSPAGMLGGATAALGANLAINGGFSLMPGNGRALTQTTAANSAFCIFTSAQVNGVIAYAGPI